MNEARARAGALLAGRTPSSEEPEFLLEVSRSSTPDLAALLCSRVCHDIISPVGAINNGLELLDESRPARATDGDQDLTSSAAPDAAGPTPR